MLTVLLLASLIGASLIGCTGNEPNAPEEPAPIPQVEEPEPEIQASDYVFPPTSFADLPEVEGELCPEFSNPAQQVKMVGVGESNAGGALIVFETGFPISMTRTQTTLRANGADLPFDCEQVPNSKNRFYCWGAPLSPGTESEITLDVQLVEYDPFDLVVLAPTLAERLSLPEGQGLEEAWQTFYNCRLDPHAPGCDLLEAAVFPPDFDPFGNEAPGLVYIWDLEVGFPELENIPKFPQRDWEELAEDIPDNCILALREPANQCAPYVFQPLEVDELVSLDDVMWFAEHMFTTNNQWYMRYQFTLDGLPRTDGGYYEEPIAPEDFSIETLEDRYSDEDDGFYQCLMFMAQADLCYQTLERPLVSQPDGLPNCATEESVARINQCMEDAGLTQTGLFDEVEVGDMQGWLDAVQYLEGYGEYDELTDWANGEGLFHYYNSVLFQCSSELACEEVASWWYQCVGREDLVCLDEYVTFGYYSVNSMTASVVPECDPEFPESLWCQGPPEDDPATQIVQACGDEVGWTGALTTYSQQALLLRSVALGLPWVENLTEFSACNRLYYLANATLVEPTGIPLQTPAVCRSMQDDTGTQTVTANFMIPFLGGQQAADDGDDGGSPALACNSCMDATACVAAGGTPNPSATQICTRCNCP